MSRDRIIMDHQNMVLSLKKSGQEIVDEIFPMKADLLHMAVGVSKEAGELLDAISRHSFYNKEVDCENVVEELGDIEFFLEGLRQAFGVTREATLAHNLMKLSARYKSGSFSNDEANARADKEAGQ